MLGWVSSLDGTLFSEAPPGTPWFNAGGPLLLLAQLANVARVLIGAGLVRGLVLGLPLAAVLGSLRDDRPRGRARRATG